MQKEQFKWYCVYMHVCVCMCMHVCVCICMYVCMYMHVCVHVRACMCACTCMYMCMYMHGCVCECTGVCVNACMCACICMYVCVCVWMHGFIFTHAKQFTSLIKRFTALNVMPTDTLAIGCWQLLPYMGIVYIPWIYLGEIASCMDHSPSHS